MSERVTPEFAIPMLPSSSISETLQFYEAMGSTITYQQKAPNNYIGLKLKGIEIHFFGLKQLKPESNFSSCYLRVNDVDKLYNDCRAGLKQQYGKIPLKGIPRINPIKDIPTYGVRQFVIVDPSGNYIRIGEKIKKEPGVLFEEDGEKPQKATPLRKAYELANRLAHGKDDLEAAASVIDKALASNKNVEPEIRFKLIVLRLDIANRFEDIEKMKVMEKEGRGLLELVGNVSEINEDIRSFYQILEGDRQ
ncbi:VOC family protein [Fulvivirga ulvae]|uniref:bleomycin resistance protein n=1 Tax=Fulvivirga ulvae TaxID=2904245 RepID=UPI001F212D83|nr:VOC family protein [Fulvivirga ulvae]UII29902.1 VOC family protein [Fulvivirga ulvae]